MELSDQVSAQMKGKTLNEFTETINYCLGRDNQWMTASKGVLASLKYEEQNSIDPVIIAQRKAYDFAANNNPVKAVEILNNLVNTIENKKERGVLKQLLAEYINIYDLPEAQIVQMSASNDNRRVLKPIEGVQYHKISGNVFDQAVACSNYLLSTYEDPNKLIIKVNGILDDLQFKENSSNIFEECFKNIAKYIGFDSQRPEQEFKKGPDVLWKVGELKYLVIECKNEATASTISKSYCNQLNGSGIWFEAKYDTTCEYTPLLVHPSTVFEYAASPNPNIRIMTKAKLDEFCHSVRNFIKSIGASNELGSQAAIRQKLIAYKLRADDIIEVYTVPFLTQNNL